MRRDEKLLRQIAANTAPRTVEQSVYSDPAAPQQVWEVDDVNAAVAFAGAYAVTGRVLRPPSGTYYRIVSIHQSVTTGAGSGGNAVGFGIQTDAEATERGAVALGQRSRWWFVRIVAANSAVHMMAHPSGDYATFTEVGAFTIYYSPFPDILISNTHPLRLYGVPDANDSFWWRVVYEQVRT